MKQRYLYGIPYDIVEITTDTLITTSHSHIFYVNASTGHEAYEIFRQWRRTENRIDRDHFKSGITKRRVVIRDSLKLSKYLRYKNHQLMQDLNDLLFIE